MTPPTIATIVENLKKDALQMTVILKSGIELNLYPFDCTLVTVTGYYAGIRGYRQSGPLQKAPEEPVIVVIEEIAAVILPTSYPISS